MITLDPSDPVPPFEQIRAQLHAAIRGGALSGGGRLPSIRQLAGDLRIAPGTVARAYRQLETEGLVRTSRSHGTIVTPDNALDTEVTTAARHFVHTVADRGTTLDDALAAIRAAWPNAQATSLGHA